MAQQTAVEWLADEISYNLFMWPNNTDYWMSGLVEKAKQMEKEQIINARENGKWEIAKCTHDSNYTFPTSEQYYNETYNK